jgi:lipid II:glycine glycyltransferase (peptidoglycan interpeptide bridge formation enzyme)
MDHFLQSDEWKEVLVQQGYEVILFHDFFGVVKTMRFGLKHLFISRVDLTHERMEEVVKKAQELQVDFIRYEPVSQQPPQEFRKVRDHNPSHTLIVHLEKSAEELLADMKSKTRYNIRLAEKKGVTTRIASIDEYDVFWELIQNTYARKSISTHSRHHYETIIRNNPNAYLVFAEHEGKVLVANLMIRHGNTVTYLHGGSDKRYQNLMGPQYAQWDEIMRSKADGYQFYDFWGIAPDDTPSHPWAGVTRFKKGFGGEVVTFPGTYEKGVSWKYGVYRWLQKIR